MDYDRKRYPGLYRLRDSLKSRPKSKLPSPEGGTSLMDNVPMRAQPSKKIPTVKPSITPSMESISQDSTARETLGGWGGKKFAGSMTTDQFVSLAGALSHAIAPDTPQGRVGAVMSRFGQQEQQRRMGMAETSRLEDVEKRKLLTKSELEIGKEERGYEHAESMAETLAGAEKAEAEKAQTRWEQTQAGTKSRHKITEAGKKSRFVDREQRLKAQYGVGKDKKDMTPAEKWKQTKDVKIAEENVLNPAFLEDPSIQVEIDFVNEYGDKPYFYQRTEGIPKKVVKWGRDIPAIPSTIEKVDVSTPEKIRDSELSREMKMKLLQTRFGFK